MRRTQTIIIAAALAALAVPAKAADQLPTYKAPPKAYAPQYYDGIYFSVAIKGGVQQASTGGGSLFASSLISGDLSASGGGVGGSVGWMHAMASGKWIDYEGSFYWQNISGSGLAVAANGAASNASFASRWSAEQVIKIGGIDPLSWLPSLGISFPGLPTPPTLPGVNVIAGGHPYVSFGVQEAGLSGSFFTASGTTWGIAPLIGAGIISQMADSTGKPNGFAVDTGAQVVFQNRGLSVSGIFAQGGGQPVFASLDMGKKYEVYGKVAFAPR